jgi:hypothetical protein
VPRAVAGRFVESYHAELPCQHPEGFRLDYLDVVPLIEVVTAGLLAFRLAVAADAGQGTSQHLY